MATELNDDDLVDYEEVRAAAKPPARARPSRPHRSAPSAPPASAHRLRPAPRAQDDTADDAKLAEDAKKCACR